MDIKTFEGGGDLQLVHGYGNGGFRVSSVRYTGDLFLLPRLTQEWTFPDLESLSFDSLRSYLGETPPALLLLGVGAPPQTQYPELASGLKALGVSLEVMSTPAACRTWNVLMSEGRDAAAALVAI